MNVESVPVGRYGFERRGWWATAGVLAIILAMWFVPAGINAAVAAPAAQPVDPSATYTVADDESGEAEATVTPAKGWETTTATTGSPLVFTIGAVSVMAQVFSDVEDIDRLWDRQARQARAGTPAAHMTRHGDYTTPGGLSGPTGTIAGGDLQGEVFLLAGDQSSGNVLRIDIVGPPGAQSRHLDDLESFVDNAELTS